MSIKYTVLVGYANGDIHSMQVMKDQQASQMATTESREIGLLTNAGFRTVVASAWINDKMRTAGFLYAAAWNENAVEILLHVGDQIASSEELFLALESQHLLTAGALLDFCHQFKIS
jgi:hypothetical protein